MSARSAAIVTKENRLPALRSQLDKLTVNSEDMEEVHSQRVSLQTLQPSSRTKDNIMNVMKSGVKQAKPKIQSKIAVFEDGRKKAQVTEKSVQTEDVGSQIKAMTSDDLTVEYWSVLAERRRLALAEALEENEQLHKDIEELKVGVDALKAENELLKPLAEEAQYLAGVLKDLVGESSEGCDEVSGENSEAADDKGSSS